MKESRSKICRRFLIGMLVLALVEPLSVPLGGVTNSTIVEVQARKSYLTEKAASKKLKRRI